jgi:hypothetical protein
MRARTAPGFDGVRVVRIAALFCGLIAGLFALVAPVGLGIDLLTPFLKLWGATPGQQLLGTLAWYAPVVGAILGGLLAFVAPGPGALLLLGAGLGWIGLGVFDAAFLRIELLVPGVASTAGALLAFFAGELELRRRRTARRNRREELRDSADRSDRTDNRIDSNSRIDTVARARQEALAREAAFNMDPLTVSREEAPPRPTREIPLTLEDVVPTEAQEPRRRAPETIWPETPAARRSVFERDAGPDLQPRRSLFERPATRMEPPAADRRERPRRREIARERDYYDDEPAPRRNLLVWFAAANVAVLIIIAVVVGYFMLERSPAPANAAVSQAADNGNVAATPAPAALPAAETPAPAVADADRLTPNVWPELALPGSQPATLPMASTDAPVAATIGPAAATVPEAPAPAVAAIAPATGTFSDPFAYCNAVKTVDYVDSRYVGPRFTADIADALRVPMESAPDRVSWRCVNGVIYACASFDWPVCAMTPTAQEMVDYCQRNPGVTRLLAPNGTWSCEGIKPRIPDGASWPVDARGFFPNAWIPVLPPQRPTG